MPRMDSESIQYIVVLLLDENMDTFALSFSTREIKMSDFGSSDHLEGQNRQLNSFNGDLAGNEDLIMEQILENLNTTPIGSVLKTIASLPEVRKNKVLNVRRQLSNGKYEINQRLDAALDKVLENLITQ